MGQVTGFAPTQAPAWQVSVCVQPLPSLQVVPLSVAQVPFTAAPAATLHAWQSVVIPPPQAEMQHTPSAQNPLAQLEGWLQGMPRRPMV